MKKLIALMALTIALNAQAELLPTYINRVADQTCEGNSTSLTLAELQDKLAQTLAKESGCKIYDMKYYDQLESSGFTANDNYNGAILVIKILNDQKTSIESAAIALRDAKICAVENGNELTLSYQLNNSVSEGGFDFMGGKSFTRKVVFEIVDGELAWAGQLTSSYERNGVIHTSASSSLFQCGKN